MTSQQSWHSVKISFRPDMVRKRIYKISISIIQIINYNLQIEYLKLFWI